ncbi:hypothetical protein AVEN_265373-1 [Araneus ventricosus]|uniref:Uncharacterized protein n=1 Tax=Araneus ventricosus TaxID=182803 RepID=A0A4Y2IT80_ARAVE|nr:hypothetical protein AVEN_265373-1 [Araneus ventricosus]
MERDHRSRPGVLVWDDIDFHGRTEMDISEGHTVFGEHYCWSFGSHNPWLKMTSMYYLVPLSRIAITDFGARLFHLGDRAAVS